MNSQVLIAAGYLAILVMPALLVLGTWIGVPYLAFGTFMLIFPLARGVFGGSRPERMIMWCEGLSTILHRLPVVCASLILISVAVVLLQVRSVGIDSASAFLGLALSLWVTLMLATCVAHELIHRREPADAIAGALLAGACGYPLLGHEHLQHHARIGDTANAEWPRIGESVWVFAVRRIHRVLGEIVAPRGALWLPLSDSVTRRLRLSFASTIGIWALFTWSMGWTGFVMYLGLVVGVAFGIQLINYLQHWGLGDDSVADADLRQLAWEDDCLFQAFVTLHLSFHQSHHQSPRLPYYRVPLAADSPKLPASYVLLMLLCLFPRWWFQVMLPVLEHWKQQPESSPTAGRRLSCFAAYPGRANR